MAPQYYFAEVQPTKCLEIKVPVVVAVADVEAVVDTIVCLPELAMRCDRIVAHVRDLTGTPIFVEETKTGEFIQVPMHHDDGHMGPRPYEPERDLFVRKVSVSGVVRIRCFYVNRENESRVHDVEDIPFTQVVTLDQPRRVNRRRDVFLQFHHVTVDVSHAMPRASRVHLTAVVALTVKVVEDQQIYVQSCPKPRECPAGNLLRDPGLESWADAAHPVFWGASNVAQTTFVHSGSFAADVGRINPALPGSLFQMLARGIVGGRQYRLTFWTAEDVLGAGVSDFTLNAEVVFFDVNGMQIGVGSQTLASTAIPDGAYTQVQFSTPITDDNVASALVRFSFIPGPTNTNSVKIDDVMLECMPLITSTT